MTAVKHENTVILGGGLAGLSASLSAGAPVYEAEERSGGVALSDRTLGFTFDRGIHILQTSNKVVLEMLDNLGVRFEVHQRKAYIYSHGKYTPYPFQVNTAGLPVGLRVKCLWQFFRRGRHPQPENYQEWIYSNLGTGFGDTFLIPYSEKFWTVPPSVMTHEWTGKRVPQPTARQVLRGALWSKQTRIGSNAEFRYPVGIDGYAAIAAALSKRVVSVHTGHRAVRLNTRQRQIHFSNGAVITYDALISTIPIPELIRICDDVPQEVRAASRRLRTNSIFVVNLGIDRPNLSERHWVHFPEKDISFFRISYPHNFGPGIAPPGMSSISAEVAYSDSQPIDKNTIVDRVIADLIRVKSLSSNDKIVLRTTQDIKYAYCIYDMHRKESLRVVLNWLRAAGVVSSGRYGLWTYFWSDEAILSGRKAAETVSRLEAERLVG